MTFSIAACSESTNNETDLSEDVSSTSEITTENTESIENKDVDAFNKKETICDVEYYVPDYANEIKTSHKSEYRSWRTTLMSLSAREIKSTNISVHNDDYINQNKNVYKWKNINKINIDECTALYFESYESDRKDSNISTASIQINAPDGIVEFNITTVFSLDNTRAQYNEFIKHVTIKGNENDKTTIPSSKEVFNEKYGSLPSWEEVLYEPDYIGKMFIIKNASCDSTDFDYYNYEYRDTKDKYFVFSAGTSASDMWFIYADRNEFAWLLNKQKQGKLKGNIVVKAEFEEAPKHSMVTLVDIDIL